MIDGLKLLMRGEELRTRVSEKIERLQAAVEEYRKDLETDSEDQTEEQTWLPEHILEKMIDEREDRIHALTLIRDHVVSDEQYLLNQADLQFAELLPPPPVPDWPICTGRR